MKKTEVSCAGGDDGDDDDGDDTGCGGSELHWCCVTRVVVMVECCGVV